MTSHIISHFTISYLLHSQDFARLIETFEDRLVTVETNVQKEIASLKLITSNLLQATGRSANFNDPSTAE
jgi:hypothetical protein